MAGSFSNYAVLHPEKKRVLRDAAYDARFRRSHEAHVGHTWPDGEVLIGLIGERLVWILLGEKEGCAVVMRATTDERRDNVFAEVKTVLPFLPSEVGEAPPGENSWLRRTAIEIGQYIGHG